MNKRILLIAVCLCLSSRPAFALIEYQDTNRFVNGFAKVISAPFYTPIEIVRQTFSQYPPFGTIGGALSGVTKTVFTLVGGLFDMAGAVTPYAKYALPFI